MADEALNSFYMSMKIRRRLSMETSQPHRDLRKIVGHANLLDSVEDELEMLRNRQYQKMATRTFEQAKSMPWASQLSTELSNKPSRQLDAVMGNDGALAEVTVTAVEVSDDD